MGRPACVISLTCVVLGWAGTACAAGPPAAAAPSSAVIDFSEDEFQFRFGTSPDDRNVWLYVPATARSVRALLLLQQNVVEQMISVHPAIRRACNANEIAIAWCQPGFDAQFEGDPQASHGLIQRRFRAVGRTIGYPELGDVPLITFGHSATCGYAQRSAEARPERVLAAIVTHGWNGKLRDVDPKTGHIIPNLPAAPAAPLAVKPYAEASERERNSSPWFFDKMSRGPWFFIRNQVVITRGKIWKFAANMGQHTNVDDRFVVLHNTFVFPNNASEFAQCLLNAYS